MPAPSDRPEAALCVASQLKYLAEISAFVAARAEVAGLTEEQAFAVQMAVDEACTNAMEHGYGGHEDGEVRLCCYLEGADFVVEVADRGKRFDPAEVPMPNLDAPLEEREVGGLGLYLMRRLMDSVEFHFDEQSGNQLVMRKHVK
jgi:serine/threonine-protein kinase RsbW